MDLLALLKWKAYPDRVMDILGRLRHVSGEEIVKVLRKVTVFGCVCVNKLIQIYGAILSVTSSCTWIHTGKSQTV